jgi:enamine deaminase RidA (YjgF/YER057c/UK114 family)
MMTQSVPSDAASSGLLPANAPPQIRRQRSAGMSLAMIDRPHFRELHLTLVPGNAEPVGALIERLAQLLKHHKAAVVRHLVFGAVTAHAETLRTMRRMLDVVDWPVTWVEGASCSGAPIAGMQIHAIVGAPVQSLVHNGRLVGRVFDDGEARHCVLGDLGPTHAQSPAPEQARETFENLEAVLGLTGMTLKNVARTWLFLNDILSWYGPFNTVRNAVFARSELRPGFFPASTAIGGRNPRRTALVAGAWAVLPNRASAGVHIVPSPEQCPAPAYGSAFSRAVEFVSAFHRQLLVSGTASIMPDGCTAHAGDTRQQIELTMEVISALLQSRGQSFAGVTRATAYFKSAADFPLFAAWRIRNGLEELPVVSACCDICRPELLFEIELDAVSCS